MKYKKLPKQYGCHVFVSCVDLIHSNDKAHELCHFIRSLTAYIAFVKMKHRHQLDFVYSERTVRPGNQTVETRQPSYYSR